jgi:hypothetical protein
MKGNVEILIILNFNSTKENVEYQTEVEYSTWVDKFKL